MNSTRTAALARDSRGRFLPRASVVAILTPVPALVREVLPATLAPVVMLPIGMGVIAGAPVLTREVMAPAVHRPKTGRRMSKLVESALWFAVIMTPFTALAVHLTK